MGELVAARKATAKSDSIETSSSLIIFYLLDHNITFWISMLISLSLYMSRPSLLQIMQSSTKKSHPSLSCGEGGWDKEKPFE